MGCKKDDKKRKGITDQSVIIYFMNSKSMVMLGMIVGSTIGGYLPMLFGAGAFSLISIFTSAIGGIIGIYIGYRITQL